MQPTKCGHSIKNSQQVVYEVVEYPYNPEWPLQRLDAGVFCSDNCLVEYLKERDIPRVGGRRIRTVG